MDTSGFPFQGLKMPTLVNVNCGYWQRLLLKWNRMNSKIYFLSFRSIWYADSVVPLLFSYTWAQKHFLFLTYFLLPGEELCSSSTKKSWFNKRYHVNLLKVHFAQLENIGIFDVYAWLDSRFSSFWTQKCKTPEYKFMIIWKWICIPFSLTLGPDSSVCNIWGVRGKVRKEKLHLSIDLKELGTCFLVSLYINSISTSVLPKLCQWAFFVFLLIPSFGREGSVICRTW